MQFAVWKKKGKMSKCPQKMKGIFEHETRESMTKIKNLKPFLK